MQLHGVKKKDLKAVVAAIANAGSSTLGGCGDINRNIMAPSAPLANNPAYQHVFDTSNVIAELFRPSTQVSMRGSLRVPCRACPERALTP